MFSDYLHSDENPDAPGYFVQWLHKKKDVFAYTMNGECHDIGTISSYEKLQKELG